MQSSGLKTRPQQSTSRRSCL